MGGGGVGEVARAETTGGVALRHNRCTVGRDSRAAPFGEAPRGPGRHPMTVRQRACGSA